MTFSFIIQNVQTTARVLGSLGRDGKTEVLDFPV